MIGVVVWADAAKQKAVIWCEDQRDLAYYIRKDEVVDVIALNKGDLVQFESCYEGGLRIAVDLKLVEASAEPHLSDVLLDHPILHQDKSPGSDISKSAHQGAEVATLSMPDRYTSRIEGRRQMGERKSAKILPFPELLRA